MSEFASNCTIWHQMGQIWDFLRSVFCSFWRSVWCQYSPIRNQIWHNSPYLFFVVYVLEISPCFYSFPLMQNHDWLAIATQNVLWILLNGKSRHQISRCIFSLIFASPRLGKFLFWQCCQYLTWLSSGLEIDMENNEDSVTIGKYRIAWRWENNEITSWVLLNRSFCQI